MRPFHIKLTCFIGLLIGFLVIIGCGSQDLLDEVGQRYRKSMTITDGETNNAMEIDISFDLDCDNDGNATDNEPFTQAFANITITVGAEAPGISLENYTVDFFPVEGVDSFGTILTPPDIPNAPVEKDDEVEIPTNSVFTFPLTIMTFGQKFALVDDLSVAPFLSWIDPQYTIVLTLFFKDTELQDRTITLQRTITIGFINRC